MQNAPLFGVCLFSACRIRECCTLLTQDIYTPKGNVRPQFVIRKSNTKGKLATNFHLQFYLAFRGLKADTVGEEQFAEFVLT